MFEFDLDPTSKEPVYKQELSLKTLETALWYYFKLVFCPDIDLSLALFYEYLILDNITILNSPFPLDTVLRTLTRVSLEAMEKKQREQYNVANTLLDRAATILNLQYKDIVVMTSQASQLIEVFEDHQLDPAINYSKHGSKPEGENVNIVL